MSVASGVVDCLIYVGSKSHPEIIKASVKNIRELDRPTSDTVLFSRVQPIYIDARLSNAVAHFGGQVCVSGMPWMHQLHVIKLYYLNIVMK